MTGTRINHHKRTALDINLYPAWRSHAHEGVIDRPLKLSAVGDQFNFIVEDMGRGFGHMFAVLQPALAQDIEEQNAALTGINRYSKADAKSPGGDSPELACLSVDMLKSLTACSP